MIQKTIIDTLRKELNSQKVITERGGCSRSTVSKHINAKLTGRKKLCRKRCTSNRDDRKLEYCQAKPIQTLGRPLQGVNWSWSQCIKSHHAQTSSGKGLPSHFWNRNIVRSILPGLRRKITGLLLSGLKYSSDKSTFCFSFGNQGLESGGRLERHRIQAALRSVRSFRSQRWFRVSLRLLVHCIFIKSKINAAVYQEI